MKAVLRWYPYPVSQWRLLVENGEGRLKARQEFLDCQFIEDFHSMQGKPLRRDRDNLVELSSKILEYRPLAEDEIKESLSQIKTES